MATTAPRSPTLAGDNADWGLYNVKAMGDIISDAALEDLFSRWKAHWAENGVMAKFIPDGIGDANEWAGAKAKVLWSLRDPNDQSDETKKWSLTEFLRMDPAEWYTRASSPRIWQNIGRCSYGFLHYPCSFAIADGRYESSGVLKSIAVMNLKKAAGTSKAKWSEIRRYAELDAPFIREELLLIKPTLIYSTALDLLCAILGLPFTKGDDRKDWNGALIISSGHPADPYTPSKVYYERVMEVFGRAAAGSCA